MLFLYCSGTWAAQGQRLAILLRDKDFKVLFRNKGRSIIQEVIIVHGFVPQLLEQNSYIQRYGINATFPFLFRTEECHQVDLTQQS